VPHEDVPGHIDVVVGAEQEWMAVQEVPVDADDAWVQVAYPVLHPHHHPNHRAVFVVFLYRYSWFILGSLSSRYSLFVPYRVYDIFIY